MTTETKMTAATAATAPEIKGNTYDFKPYNLADFKIKVGSATFNAHRLKLAEKCTYFDKFFLDHSKIDTFRVHVVQDIESAYYDWLSYIYAGQVPEDQTALRNVIDLCHTYGCKDLRVLEEAFKVHRKTWWKDVETAAKWQLSIIVDKLIKYWSFNRSEMYQEVSNVEWDEKCAKLPPSLFGRLVLH